MDKHKPNPNNKTIPIKVNKEQLDIIKNTLFKPSVIRPNRTRAERLLIKFRRLIHKIRAEIRRFYFTQIYRRLS